VSEEKRQHYVFSIIDIIKMLKDLSCILSKVWNLRCTCSICSVRARAHTYTCVYLLYKWPSKWLNRLKQS